jgi:hypothetical protein
MLAFFQNFKFSVLLLYGVLEVHIQLFPKVLTVFSSDTGRRRRPEEKFFLGGGEGGES